MGKYLKKPKPKPNSTNDLIDVSSLGVRTRAKTLALQKQQLQSPSTTTQTPEHELSFLQLRSRKLEKPPSSCCNNTNPNPRLLNSEHTSFSDNNIDFDGNQRGTRESTPCSFIRDSNDSITPGSSTQPTNRPASNRSMQRIMPTAQEIEEFFALHAQEQQRLFSEKYNFDIVNEKPLEGRYEWVRVQP